MNDGEKNQLKSGIRNYWGERIKLAKNLFKRHVKCLER